MAWVRASTPVEAVTRGGQVRVRSGSSMATSGMRWGSAMSNLTLVTGSVMMAKRVTSLPVPAVVLTTISGSLGLLDLVGALVVDDRAVVGGHSRRQPCLCRSRSRRRWPRPYSPVASLSAATPPCTSVVVGSPGMSLKTPRRRPADVSCSITLPANGRCADVGVGDDQDRTAADPGRLSRDTLVNIRRQRGWSEVRETQRASLQH